MMKTARKPTFLLLLVTVLIVALVAILMSAALRPQIVNPHEGQVIVYDGIDWIWMTPLEGVEANTIKKADIAWDGSVPSYISDEYDVLRGIDVSEHQNEIDWKKVAADGIDFAFIRCGYRGNSKGALVEDKYFRDNMQGALDAGLKVGVYFYSQAINVQEAIEEADYVLSLIRSYDVTMPVAFDWENESTEWRTAGLRTDVLSDCAVAFCETVKQSGYTPAIYFYRRTGYYGLDLTRMTDYVAWFALPESPFPNFYYKVDIWQYSWTESIDGIEGGTDMNLMFLPKSA